MRPDHFGLGDDLEDNHRAKPITNKVFKRLFGGWHLVFSEAPIFFIENPVFPDYHITKRSIRSRKSKNCCFIVTIKIQSGNTKLSIEKGYGNGFWHPEVLGKKAFSFKRQKAEITTICHRKKDYRGLQNYVSIWKSNQHYFIVKVSNETRCFRICQEIHVRAQWAILVKFLSS